MSSPPIPFYTRLRTILLKCNEFDSDSSLRSVFVTAELVPFLAGVPEAPNRGARVDALLAYLYEKRLSNGDWVLPYFLSGVRDRYHIADERRTELDMVIKDLPVDRKPRGTISALGEPENRVSADRVEAHDASDKVTGEIMLLDQAPQNEQNLANGLVSQRRSYFVVMTSALIGFLTGVLGNLIASWIQKEALHDTYTPISLVIIGLLTVAGLIIGVVLQRR